MGELLVVDVLILGGGPAGATLGLLLKGGFETRPYTVVVVDRSELRRGIPEETLVASAAPRLQRLGLMASLRAGGFRGTARHVSIWGDGHPVVRRQDESSRGFKVNRTIFDADLRRMFRSLGGQLLEDTRLKSHLPVEGHGVVTLQTGDGRLIHVDARAIVVAVGKSVGGNLLPLELGHQLPATVALSCRLNHGRYKDATVIEAVPAGWLWWLPLHSGGTSLTLFADADEIRERSADVVFGESLAASSAPEFAGTLRPSFSSLASARLMRTNSGCLLIGDAASTIDPLTSQGIEKALASAEAVFPAVCTLLERPELRQEVVSHHESWERGLYFFHARETLHTYAREVRFSNHPFWKRRHEQVQIEVVARQSNSEIPPRIIRAPALGRKRGLRRTGRLFEPCEGFSLPGDLEVLTHLGNVPVAPIFEALATDHEVPALLEELTRRPEYVALSARHILQMLTELVRRGMIVAAPENR